MTIEALGGLAAVALTAAGLLALRRAWNDPGRRPLVGIGWLLLGAAGPGWLALAAATDKAIAFAMLAPSLVAFAIIACGADFTRRKRRPARDSLQSVELAAGRSSLRRGVLRTALAGPLSAVTALAISMLVATRAPFGDAGRLISAGLLAPAVWAGFMAWSLYHGRLDRVFAVLVLIMLITGVGIFL